MSGRNYSGTCLSVALVARNDEEVLAETLSNVRPWADEVVVLDAGSRDRSAEIAKSLGARVVAAPWRQDHAAAKNHILGRLTGHWILWLEPGERVDEAAWPELRRLVDRAADRDTAYALLVQIPPGKKSNPPEQAALIRLIPNRPELQFEGRVGETMKPSIERAGMKTALAPGLILRHARCHDVRWKSARARETLDLAALDLTTPGRPVRALLATGDAASDLEDWSLARQMYCEAVRTAARGSLEMLLGYYGILASIEGESGNSQRQLAVCLGALEVFPLDMQLLCAMGGFLLAQDRLDLAVRTFQTAMDYGQVHLETWHPADIEQMAAVQLALTLQLAGQDDRAQAALQQCLARWPGSTRARRHLVELHVEHGQAQDAVAVAEGLDLPPSAREPLSSAIRGACLAAGQQWTGALACLQSAYLAGCEDPICLRWLARVLLSTNQVPTAVPVLRHWASVEPGNAELLAYLKTVSDRSDPAGADSEAPPAGTWHRIDPGTTSMDVFSGHIPIVSQFVSDNV